MHLHSPCRLFVAAFILLPLSLAQALTGLTFKHYIKAHNTGDGDYFGSSVAVSGETIVVGASYEDSSGTGTSSTSNESSLNAGAVYVYERINGSWTQQAYLKASNTGSNDLFGSSVAISGDTIVVGASHEDGGGSGVNPSSDESMTDSGAVYVFVRQGGGWVQQAYIKASNPGSGDWFGFQVSISGDRMAVSAIGEDGSGTGVNAPSDENALTAGAVYVFSRSGGVWTQEAYVKPSNTGSGDWFGRSLQISGQSMIVGAPYEDSSTRGNNGPSNEFAIDSGAAYVFTRIGGAWTQQAFIKSPNSDAGDFFGTAVTLFGDRAVIGATSEDGSGSGVDPADNNLTLSAGAAYAYFRSSGIWYEKAYLKPPATGAFDSFGSSLCLSGNTLLVGSLYEDGSGTGINPPVTETSFDSGAAYIFTHSSSDIWSYDTTLKASNTGQDDYFGISLAHSGNTIVIGAPGEDGMGIGIDPVSNELASDGSGAAYMFERSGTPDMAVLSDGYPVPSGGQISFGPAVIGQTLNRTFAIVNEGDAQLDFSGSPSITFSGPDAAMFAAPTQMVGFIGAGGAFEVTVTFTPSSAGAKSAVLAIQNNDGDHNPYLIQLDGSAPAAEIALVRGPTNVPDGSNQSLGGVIVGESADVVFTVRNTGGQMLGLNGSPRISLAGPDAASFSLMSLPAATIPAGGGSNFVVRFTPASGGPESATLTIPNTDSDESPFDINLSGAGLTFTNDQDNDGLSDASESQMASLGFDWQVQQTAMVTQLYGSANQAGLYSQTQYDASRNVGRNDVLNSPNTYDLYSPAQIQALNVGTPLLQKNPSTGTFTLTLGIEKSTNLTNFTPLPFVAPQMTVNGQGKLEFQFTVPGNAAFFRVQAQ